MSLKIFALLASCAMLAAACAPKSKNTDAPAVVWKLDNVESIGGHKVAFVGGAPEVADGALRFDGKSQGVLLPVFPVSGWRAFTIELDVFPEAGGEFEQRMFHGGPPDNTARAMIELRSNPDGSWFLDTYLRDRNNRRLALIDEKKTRPSGRWYTIRLVYDGKLMSHYVDGVLEDEGAVELAVMPEGVVSLGVRQNEVNWFKGRLREARFWPVARRDAIQSDVSKR